MHAELPAWRVFGVIAGIYTIQSTAGAITFQGVPVVLRAAGAPLDLIGLISLFMLPWAMKFLWAPAVERWRLPVAGGRRSRPIILVGQALIAIVFAALSLAAPSGGLMPLLVGLALIALLAATVDIACDAFTIEQLSARKRGWGNVMQVGGGYAGIMLGGLFLVLVEAIGWQGAMLVVAGAVLLLTLPMAVTREPAGALPHTAGHRPSLGAALRRPAIRYGLVAMLLFQAGLRLTQGMTGPFLVDQGVSPATLGWLTGTLGTALSLTAVVAIGFPIRFWGAAAVLRALLALQAVLFLLFAVAGLLPAQPMLWLAALLLVKTAAIAATFVALYTLAMEWSSLRQAGVDFTLLQCADAAIAAAAGLGGGVLAQHLGYAACFGVAAALAALSLAVAPALLRRIGRSAEAPAYA